jgi:hypothetical protein
MRESLNILLSPVNLGRTRWGQYPKSRMSLLSVMSFFLLFVVMVGGCLLKWLGFRVDGPITMAIVFASFGLVFFSGALDNRRDRRKRFVRR